MWKEESRRKTFAVLEARGVSLAEYYVMCTVGYEIRLEPNKLASASAAESRGDSRGEFPVADHLGAVNRCIEKHLLCILTPEECEREAERRRSSELPELTDTPLRPGAVDFTPEGYALYRDIILNIYGEGHLRSKDSGWLMDNARKEVHVLAGTEEECRSHVSTLLSNPDLYIGDGAAVTSVSGPQAIGHWRTSRFIILPMGFHSKVNYVIPACVG